MRILSLFLLIKPFRNWLYQRNEETQLKINKEIDRLHGTLEELAQDPTKTLPDAL